MSEALDRGAHSRLTFDRCARGFTLRTDCSGGIPQTYAFDEIETLCDWLRHEYSDRPMATDEQFRAILEGRA